MKESAKAGSKKWRPKQQIIVLIDGAGNYYEISRAELERSKVSEDRIKLVAKLIQDVPFGRPWIPGTSVPGSVVAPEFVGGRLLHYAGFYLTSD
jgi:hypothetical protein